MQTKKTQRIPISRAGRAQQATKLYLDTSILHASFFGDPQVKLNIKHALQDAPLQTCMYVFTEIRNHAVQLIDLYFQLRAFPSINDAIARIIAKSVNQPRKLQKTMYLLGAMLGGGTSEVERFACAETRIMAFVEFCDDLVTDVIDGHLECPLSKKRFATDPELSTMEVFNQFRASVSCTVEEPAKCKSDDFRKSKASLIERIRLDAGATSEGTTKLQRYLNKLEPHGNWQHARGLQKRCNKFADMLIALQCPNKSTLTALDGSFADLGRLLGRQFKIVPVV